MGGGCSTSLSFFFLYMMICAIFLLVDGGGAVNWHLVLRFSLLLICLFFSFFLSSFRFLASSCLCSYSSLLFSEKISCVRGFQISWYIAVLKLAIVRMIMSRLRRYSFCPVIGIGLRESSRLHLVINASVIIPFASGLLKISSFVIPVILQRRSVVGF